MANPALSADLAALARARTPAISLPCGTDAAGLPIGLQLAARAGNDWGLLETARAFETVAAV